MSVLESAQRIAQDEIDFLIDLTGNTLHTRSQVFALRPARIQAHWLGFVGTMGSNYYDYIIADDIVAPIGDEEYFSEKILRLKSGMHITDDTRIIVSDHQDRKTNGLPASGVVFGCFCQTFKIQPEIFSAWMRILSEVPNSVLWLASGPVGSIENLKLYSEHYQIDPGRIIVAQRCGIDEYLSRFTLMDVYLDTFPYTSGTVASDALYAGCPVVTLSGKTMVSRMAGSILKYAGFPELVTYSIDSYIKKAIYLANEPEELLKLRNKLLIKKQQKELFNTKKSAKELEKIIIDVVTYS
jgi:predicted O-linked N-acetylglucosamine transferase (SPINDLY family)